MSEFNSHLDFFELLNLIRCGRNSAYETGLRQVNEAIPIKELNQELNTKDEWGNSNALREKDRIRRDDSPNSFEEGIIRTRKSNNSH